MNEHSLQMSNECLQFVFLGVGKPVGIIEVTVCGGVAPVTASGANGSGGWAVVPGTASGANRVAYLTAIGAITPDTIFASRTGAGGVAPVTTSGAICGAPHGGSGGGGGADQDFRLDRGGKLGEGREVAASGDGGARRVFRDR